MREYETRGGAGRLRKLGGSDRSLDNADFLAIWMVDRLIFGATAGKEANGAGICLLFDPVTDESGCRRLPLLIQSLLGQASSSNVLR